jgi:hypothetical protein
MNRLPAVALLALVWLTGCVSAQTFRSGTGKTYRPTRAEDVLVFYEVTDVKRSYEVIGEITTSGSSGMGKNEGDLVKKARQKAAEMGANAILVRPIDPGTGGEHVMAVLFGSNDKNQHMTAIRFTDEGPAH